MEPGTANSRNADDEMVVIPAGSVTLSDRRSQHQWSVELATYQLSAMSITQQRYARITGRRPSAAQGDRLPVDSVSWLDAVRFCNALSAFENVPPAYRIGDGARAGAGPDWDGTSEGYRLPTEAEWEHACRAGTSGARYGPLDDIAWYRRNSGDRIHDVGGKWPNAWGLYDMLGNAWEWCWDIYDADAYGSYRVLRGGGWSDEHWSCRASVRRRSHPTFAIDDLGFRVARSISQ